MMPQNKPSTNPSLETTAGDGIINNPAVLCGVEDYLDQLGRERKDQPVKTNYRARQWLELYPELKETFMDLLIEKLEERKALVLEIEMLTDKWSKLPHPYNLISLELINIRQGAKLAQLDKEIRWFKFGLIDLKGVQGGLSEEQIEMARQYPMSDILEGKGIKGKFCCPFHIEKTPSFQVYKDNAWYCFGCLKYGNNAIDYVMEKENLNFVEAVNYLLKIK